MSKQDAAKKLIVDDLDYVISDKVIYSKASMEVNEGEIRGVLGPNGAGKTTFFDIICSLRNADRGIIKNDFLNQVYLSQTIMTPPVLRMGDISRLALSFISPKRPSKQVFLDRLNSWAPEVSNRFSEIWSKKSAICSYGEKRWFFTLTLLASESDLIILDEPTAGVDPEFRHYIWKCLSAAAKEGRAILVSSHNVNEVADNCDVFYMIYGHRFNIFNSSEEFMSCHEADSLDRAFINAATMTSN
ncbi:hypothetical protein L861_23235 [Litchfieldella anticariensis FP35 = DSM 16096]|uniref:ABC transporter domain-containing protein n=1 Tax=Litchfieldella anticariensis (strain DSM 16096 / CECT 5854 / CIP 108499 / LMG 22089 / FP35) TaxID=1121939 RepID=S2LEQ8_LITA3|nr:AAA family ATPase [Halomonas anticariensis]EPC03226.1 hypothetical protein L861_23235 [Halomonas anticariensis FP35 = DSM 16096]